MLENWTGCNFPKFLVFVMNFSESESDSVEDDIVEEDSQSISSSDPISTDESSKDLPEKSSRVLITGDSIGKYIWKVPIRNPELLISIRLKKQSVLVQILTRRPMMFSYFDSTRIRPCLFITLFRCEFP